MYYYSSFVTDELAGNLLFYDSSIPGYVGPTRIAMAAVVVLAIVSLLIVCLYM